MERREGLCILCAVVVLSIEGALAQVTAAAIADWTGCVGSVYPCEAFQEDTCLETEGAHVYV